MNATIIRQASEADAAELARLRWDFSPYPPPEGSQSFDTFRQGFRAFLKDALAGGDWVIWVAEQEGRLVATIWVQAIHKVPYPDRFGRRYGYVTNVYAEPEVRGRGLGSRLIRSAIDGAREQGLEFLVLWPSEESVAFYERAGFHPSPDALELHFDL